jgi:hypothetical protein
MVIDLFCKSVGELPHGPGAPDDRYGPRAPFEPSRSEKQQFALAASVVAPVFAVFDDDGNQTVVDATSQFIAQGGQWVPSRALARVIDQTALDQRQCRHL